MPVQLSIALLSFFGVLVGLNFDANLHVGRVLVHVPFRVLFARLSLHVRVPRLSQFERRVTDVAHVGWTGHYRFHLFAHLPFYVVVQGRVAGEHPLALFALKYFRFRFL